MKCPHCGADNRDDARFCGSCGRAAAGTEPSRSGHAPPPSGGPDLAGREIGGRYRILTKLGEGGMGAVYRGEQISLKRKVAIKLLRPELSADAGLVRRFNAEAELAARLSHPNTVNIHDFGQDADGTLFIVMELVEGRSLRHTLTTEGPLPPRRALAIAAQLAASLGDAHTRGIVHRDLKPDNVMLAERGKDRDVVRVLDFGIAKLREDGRATANVMTQAGDLVGTPQYMAPEQIRGEAVDGRTDVYALGAILYEMLTGRLPFEAPSVMAILSKHLLETPEPPSRRRPDLGLPPELDALVMDAMAKDIALRIPSMDQLAERVAAMGTEVGGGSAAAWRSPGSATPAPFGPSTPPAPHGAFAPPASATPASFAPPAPASYPGPPGATPYAAYPPAYPGGPAPSFAPPFSPVVGGVAGTPFDALASGPPIHIGETPSRSRAPLWIGLGVAAVAIGAGAYVWLSSDTPETPPIAASGSPDPWAGKPTPPDPWAGPTPAPDPVPEPAADPSPAPSPRAEIPGELYRDPSGWRVILPPGMPSAPHQEDGAALFTGLVDGRMIVIGLGTGDDLPGLSEADLREGVGELAASMNGTLASFDQPTIQGARRFRAFIDVAPLRFEAVLFVQGDSGLVALYGVEATQFGATESARREFFERRLVAPGR